MAIEDLDLEFEDETEAEKGDALDVDVDLSFSASPESVKQHMSQKRPQSAAPKPRPKAATPKPQPRKPTQNNVSNIQEARPKARPQAQAKPMSQASPTPDYAEHNMQEISELRSEIEYLKSQIQAIQHQADIKVAVAEAQTSYMVEVVSNAKVMDHQVTQILTRINKKAPALGSEVQTIKKYVSEFLKKTSPQKKGGG